MGSDPASDDTVAPDSFDDVLRRVVRAPGELTVGEVLVERFMIDRALGVGGMGTVYAATDRTLGRTVAIKLHHAPGGGARLRREAIAMARLAHPNVVAVYEVGEVDQRPFVVMEYVTGTTLRAWLAAAPRSVPEILAVLIAAGEGLAAAHAAGLIHRDIKPENVLIGEDGRARVGDFGLARDRDSADAPGASASDLLMSPMTQTGAVLGTPAYMAPEQCEGRSVDARSDQFAFCVTAWEALWGERPYAGATFEQLVEALRSGTRREPPAVPKIPAQLRAALERGLAPDPEDRFATMTALIAALRPRPRRRRYALIAALIAGVALGGGAIYAVARPGPSELDRKRAVCLAIETSVAKRRADAARTAACDDPAHLAASPSIPGELLDAYVEARAAVRLGSVDVDSAPRAAIEATLARLRASPAANEKDVASAILVIEARLAGFDGRLAESDKRFADAYYEARTIDDADDALEALLGLIDNATRLRVDHRTADQWLRTGLADGERLRTRAPWFLLRMLLSDAEVADQEGDAPRALADLAKAKSLAGDSRSTRAELLSIEGDVLIATDKRAEGIAAFEESLRLTDEPRRRGLTLSNYAAALISIQHFTRAMAVATEAAALLAQASDSDSVAWARVDLAAAMIGVNRDDDAEPLLLQSRVQLAARYGEHNAVIANIDADLAVIDADRGKHAEAIARTQAAMAIEEPELGPADPVIGERMFSIATSQAKLGEWAPALASIRRAVAVFQGSGSSRVHNARSIEAWVLRESGDPAKALVELDGVLGAVADTDESAQLLGLVHLERGASLLALGRRTEARAELADARRRYTELGMQARLAQLDALDARAR